MLELSDKYFKGLKMCQQAIMNTCERNEKVASVRKHSLQVNR